MLEIKRNGLIITSNGSLDASAGSYDVPVSLTNDDTYSDYVINMYVGWRVRGVLKKRKAKTDSSGNYLIPGEAFQQNGMINISFLLEKNDKTQGFMTNAYGYQVKDAPNVIIEVPPDPTWQDLVREWIEELTPDVDPSLTKEGYAADAKHTGDAIKELSNKKANVDHTHDEYASKEHTHSQYLTEHQSLANYYKKIETYSQKEVDTKVSELSEKIADLSTYVTPQMYGAKGDGTTDDTQAFINALAENDNVFVPKGNYLITDTLDISYKKSLYSDDGQRATLLYNGTNSVVSIGRMSVFRNINITIKNAFSGIVFDTNNYNKNSGEPALNSRVEHVVVVFEVYSPSATLIGLTADSGTDANNKPKLYGFCFQTYHDIHVDNSSEAYGYGIKMEVIQSRDFSQNASGYPWITHISYSDISLAHPHTAIKSLVTLPSGATFERYSGCNMAEIRFDNVYSQCFQETDKHELTRYFLDLEYFGGFFTKCKAWDYHYFIASGGVTDTDKIINIIGENVTACLSDCNMSTWNKDLLNICRFTAESEFNVADNPEYFMNKYFSGTILTDGYDIIDAKIDSKLSSEYIANISEEKINEVLYSGYSNVLDDPLTQIKIGQRYSGSNYAFETYNAITTIVIPIVVGGNIIRWTPSTYELSAEYMSAFFFNSDDFTDAIRITENVNNLWVDNTEGGYLQIDNPSGYKYVSIPFKNYGTGYVEISSETMTMTINREITGDEGKSYTEYLKESVIDPAIKEGFENLAVPTKTSDLENDSQFVTQEELEAKKYLTQHQDISGKADKANAETWTFTLEDGTTVTKKVVLA